MRRAGALSRPLAMPAMSMPSIAMVWLLARTRTDHSGCQLLGALGGRTGWLKWLSGP